MKDVEKLERHAYAPELNSLHLKDGRVLRTPGCLNIAEAFAYAIKNGLYEKNPSLIEKVEKAIQDEGILHQEIIRAQPKIYSVQEVDSEGKLSGAFLAVVMPNETLLGIYRCEKLINL